MKVQSFLDTFNTKWNVFWFNFDERGLQFMKIINPVAQNNWIFLILVNIDYIDTRWHVPSVRPLLNLGQRRALPGGRKIELYCYSVTQSLLFEIIITFTFSFENQGLRQGGRVDRHRIQVAWSVVWSIHSQWSFRVPCHRLVLVHCFFLS